MTSPNRRGAGRWLWVAVILVAAAAGGWFYFKPTREAPLDFKAVPVSRGDITQSVTANGQLSAMTNVTVGTQVSGIITYIGVDFNSRVTNKQVIAQIDPETYQQSITQADAELANAKAALELAALDMRRASELRTNELIAIADFDKTVVSLHQAEATVRTREASLAKAKVDFDRTTIYAPIDGIVINRAVDKGQTVASSFNAPTLFNIVNDLRFMRIEAMVSEADVGGVEEGQNVRFTVDAFPGRNFTGTVLQVRYAPVTNQNVVNYTTVIDVRNDDGKLRPGMTANSTIITAQRTGVLKVPNAALRFRPPENATIKGDTNNPAGAATQAMAAAGRSGGPGMFNSEGGERLSQEERRKRWESMTPEQREEMRARRQARMGEGGGNGPGPQGRPAQEAGPHRTVYVLEKESTGEKHTAVLKPVPVKIGIADASFTEIVEGLQEGDQVVTGVNLPTAALPTAMGGRPGGSPFGGPFGGGPPRR